ncbi:MAG: hypothetical protein KatS3mg132_836 [Limisphaera sp.]|nr:MAG: hypothetical protein KatS3mg132_836 [Limisphaera sp.]
MVRHSDVAGGWEADTGACASRGKCLPKGDRPRIGLAGSKRAGEPDVQAGTAKERDGATGERPGTAGENLAHRSVRHGQRRMLLACCIISSAAWTAREFTS